MSKIVYFPKHLNLERNSYVWDLICSEEFTKIRCGRAKEVNDRELSFLERGFEMIGCTIEEKKGETPNLLVFEKASYDLTKMIMNS